MNKSFDSISMEIPNQKQQQQPEGNQNYGSNSNNNKTPNVTYGLDEVPPWYLCVFMALQHYLTMIGAIVSIPFILTPALCMKDDDPARGHIISTMIFVTAIVTFVQVTFGCRLPIVQGGTISFLVPTLAILQQSRWKCPAEEVIDTMDPANRTELWQTRMRELSGAIMVSALFQVFIGFFGIIGLVIRFVSPLTIVPTVGIVGLSLYGHAAKASSTQWGIAFGTIILMTLFSQCMNEVGIPCLRYRKGSGLSVTWFNLFKLFPVILTITIMWAVCGILTMMDYFEVGHPARTDTKIQIMVSASWFRLPYPFQWGPPTFSVSSILGMLTGVLACTVESLSYYPSVARMCNGPPPPVHVFNRGIGIEGLGTVLAGIWGSGNGTNTFGENVGTIGVTKVGSRRVIQYACVLMLFQGIIGKFGAAFIIIPEPIIGGIFCVMFGMIAAFGLSNLQYVDLNSARNLYIVGFSLFFALVLPKALSTYPDVIQTGNETVDNILKVLLGTSILVGGATGCLMDHLIPGTLEERGIIAFERQMKIVRGDDSTHFSTSSYDFPIGMSLIRRWTWLSYIPCMPTYNPQEKGN